MMLRSTSWPHRPDIAEPDIEVRGAIDGDLRRLLQLPLCQGAIRRNGLRCSRPKHRPPTRDGP